jgi:hypothetical protein
VFKYHKRERDHLGDGDAVSGESDPTRSQASTINATRKISKSPRDRARITILGVETLGNIITPCRTPRNWREPYMDVNEKWGSSRKHELFLPSIIWKTIEHPFKYFRGMQHSYSIQYTSSDSVVDPLNTLAYTTVVSLIRTLTAVGYLVESHIPRFAGSRKLI